MTDVTVVQPAEATPAPVEVDVVDVTDDESAIDRVTALLNPTVEESAYDTQTRTPETPDATPAEPEAEEAAPEDAEAQTDELASEEDAGEQEPAEEGVELPNTLQGLAEMLEVDVSDLTGNLAVTVEGEEVTLAELMRGHLRESDYTRKTQSLAEQRKAFDAERQQIAQSYQSYQQQTNDLVTLLQSQLDVGPSPDELSRLLDDDPHEYMRQKELSEGRQAALQQALQAKMQQEYQAEQQALQQKQQFRQSQQQALLREIPDLADEAKATELEKTMSSYLEKQKFSPQETSEFFNGAWDHRMIMVVKDAAEYQKFKEGDAQLKKRVKKLPRVQRPGSAADKADREAGSRSATLNRMRQRGDDNSAIDYVSKLLS